MIRSAIVLRSAAALDGRRLAWAGGLALLLGLAVWNLPAYPATWFDEGQFMHVPKALVQHGIYADWSSEGPRYFGPTTAAGPTLLLPIAAMFEVAGVGLMQARLVVVVYFIAALVLSYLVAARLYGTRVGLLAAALLLASRGVATLDLGRQVLGEIPALAFVLAGLLSWIAALQAGSTPQAILAGLCWGLAMITKNQVTVALTPALLLLSLADVAYFRNGRWSLRLLPPLVALGMAAAWLVVLFALLGPGNLSENLELTRTAAAGAIIVLEPAAMLRALRYLVSPRVFGGLLLPALAYAAWRLRGRRDVPAQAESAVLIIVVTWLGWYFASLGWPRYAFVGVALAAIPVTVLVADALRWALHRKRHILTGAIGIASALLVAVPLGQTVAAIMRPDRSVLSFADYLERTVAHDVVIETWEPELGGLTDHRFHYPPQSLLDVAVRAEFRGSKPARYDLAQTRAPYVVVGPFGAWTGVYQGTELAKRYRPIHQDGSYVLYERLR